MKINRNNNQRVSSFLDQLYSLNYNERPVNILEFISNERFLGKFFSKGDLISDVWKKELVRIFSDDSKYLIILTGGIGTGKTTISVISMLYVMYRILCLKDPWGYFRRAQSGNMAITFFNLTKTLSDSKAYRIMQDYLLGSPWFLEKGRVRGKEDLYLEFPLFGYVLASPYARGFGMIGQNIITGSMDEVDSPTESEKQKHRVLKAYQSSFRRFESRFVVDGCSLGRFILSASKSDEAAFLETLIAEMKMSNNVYVVDIPTWASRPSTDFSGQKFKVAMGNAYQNSKILNDKIEEEEALKSGFQIIEIPIEYKSQFDLDIVGALRDIAGVSVKSSRMYKLLTSEKFLMECYDETKLDPFSTITIEIGLKDEVELIDYFDIKKLRVPKHIPRFISMDWALSKDALGLACSCARDFIEIDVEKEDGTFDKQVVPVVETDFSIRLKAKEGSEIPLHKVRKFVLDLRARGLNIELFTSDLKIASSDNAQILENSGIKTEYFSVDKDDKPYIEFRDLIHENRWVSHKNPYAHFELINLDYDRNKGKVDHPDKVKEVLLLDSGDTKEVVLVGSKDVADAICASVVNTIYYCKTPVNVNAIKDLVEKASGTAEKMNALSDKYWWVSGVDVAGTEKKSKVVGTSVKESNITTFIDILKKSTGK